MKGFPTRAPAELEERPQARRWMVEALWSEQGVGIVGGEPKCGKSFLALDIAVAVAAGVPCLRHFRPAASGPVLLFAAEDAGHIVRARLQGIAKAAGTAFETGWVDEANVARVRTGHAVRISGPAFPDMELEGKVVYVSSEATPAPGRNLPTFEVTAVVDRLDEKQRDIVRLGMSADMKIEVYRNDKALVVPIEAVDLAEERPRLRVWDETTAAGRMVYVVTGTTTTDSVEILSGIAPGDRVVVP